MDKIIDDNNKIVGNINLDNSNIKFIKQKLTKFLIIFS